MEKIWLQSYPAKVPAEISIDHLTSLVDVFERACAGYADKVAYLSMGRAMTYRELDMQSRAFAGWLQAQGVQKGERVALMMPNLLQYPVALFGILRAGCVVVNCNPLYTARELEYQLKDAGATAMVVLENFARTLAEIMPRTALRQVVVTSMGEMLGPVKGRLVNLLVRHVKKLVPRWSLHCSVSFAAALQAGRAHGFTPVDIGHKDIAFLQYTGGTTGIAKGAMLTHGNITANVMQAYHWVKPVLKEGEELVLTALPLFHIFALTANCLTFLMIGATNLLIANPRDLPGLLKQWSKYPVSVVTGVNTLFKGLLQQPGFAALDFSSLKVSLGGGMAVQAAVARDWLQATGIPLLQAYGLTETSPAATISPLDMANFNGAVGLPMPSTELSIRDERGEELALGAIGEICLRGPQVMKGYWQRPGETESAFFDDGFLRTGDLGYIDEKGFVFLVDRKKDTIIVSGFNVYPNEVEDIVARHPGVRDVAAIGIDDEHSGEVVKIFVVRQDPALSEAALIAHCRRLLTPYKVPKKIEFRDDLPRTHIGKVLRRALK